ncbi:hypothetical protein PENTCL1PPCAC_15225 [Pristionchus entomophagus]|uniref:Major sperm protein n=1 Tax=Pristionchus entomophagus TaxID=358040 RepID=A0AAV5TBV1_9BILA|nr:hypothetical protein PENTCL1PPCAC_15225 [Pristionchus entomophagus]
MEEKKKREMEEKEEEEKEIRVKTENNSEDTPSTSDSSDPIVIEPAEMTWGAPKGEKRRMRIVNNSNERMAIKMKCSDIHAYQFEPIFSFVGVRETAKIKVVRHGIMVKEDKAVIMMVPCKDSDQDPAAVFKATPFDQQEKRTIPFKVRPPIHNDGKLGTKEEPMEI